MRACVEETADCASLRFARVSLCCGVCRLYSACVEGGLCSCVFVEARERERVVRCVFVTRGCSV